MKKGRPPSQVSSQALLDIAKSISFNTKNYIPKDGAFFSLFRIEILAGLTVALALVPEAIAFAFVAGVTPLSGLYAAFIVGLITALIGGRPGMISGATGALAVVMVALVADHGVEYLFATVVLMGILQLISGVFKLGKFIRMVPQPVMLGFVNGLAIVIGISQLSQFKTVNSLVKNGSQNVIYSASLVSDGSSLSIFVSRVHFLFVLKYNSEYRREELLCVI